MITLNQKTEYFSVLIAVATALTLSGCSSHQKMALANTVPDSTPKLVSVAGQETVQLDPVSYQMAGITTVAVGSEQLRSTLQPTGQISTTDSSSVEVTSRLPGRIASALVGIGSIVHQGQVLATVDSVDLTQAEAAYQTAQSHLALTYQQLLQQKQLAGYGALSQQPVEDAQKAFAAAQASVAIDLSQINLDRTALSNTQQLVSMGEITRKPVEDAQNAFAQAQSARIQSEVTLHSAQNDLARTKSLFEGGIYSRQQLEDAETTYNTAVAAVNQNQTQEKLAKEELNRQQHIYDQNLNGASSIQQAQAKLQQDQHTYQNDLTSLELSRKELTRAKAVLHSGIPVNQAVQQAEDAYDEARVALQGTANTLQLYGVNPGQGVAQLANGQAIITVTAPMDGIVSERNMVVGQLIDTSTPIVKIVNLDQVYLNAQVYEKDLESVAVGDPIQLRVSALPGKVFTGRVASIGSTVDPDTHTITVRTLINNPGWILRPGMYASVLIGSRKALNTLAVPQDAVIQSGDKQFVYVEIAPRQFLQRPVTTGSVINGQVQILSGLTAGDKVVVSGNELLQTEQQHLESTKGDQG